MRPGIKFYTKLEETSLEPKKYHQELKEAGLSGKDILFTERKEHSGNYVVFFETKDGYEYRPYDNTNGLASGQKAKTLEACISRAHCMGLYENDTGVAKPMKAADGTLDVKVNFKESKEIPENKLVEGFVSNFIAKKLLGADPMKLANGSTKTWKIWNETGDFKAVEDAIENDEDCKLAYEMFKKHYGDAPINMYLDYLDEKANKAKAGALHEGQYSAELTDQLENDIILAANTLTQGNDSYVGLVDVLEALEYDFGYNYAAELSPKITAIAKYLEQAGYIVEE